MRQLLSGDDALTPGRAAWLSPQLWNRSLQATRAHLVAAASVAEHLRTWYPEQLVFVLNSELTLFMQGIIPGKACMQRLKGALAGGIVRAGQRNQPLNAFLAQATMALRERFHGTLSYASLIWEQVDWNLFDVVDVDHYWNTHIKDQYLEMLKPLGAFGKPIVITAFGFRTMRASSTEARALGNVDHLSRFTRLRLATIHERDEQWQARQLVQ